MSLLARLLLIAVFASLAVHAVRAAAPSGPATIAQHRPSRSLPHAGDA